MNRTISYKRLFKVGDFNNVTFEDTFTDIPDEFSLNEDLVSNIRLLQMLNVEIMYKKYLELSGLTNKLPSYEEMYAMLEEMKTETMEKIRLAIQKEN